MTLVRGARETGVIVDCVDGVTRFDAWIASPSGDTRVSYTDFHSPVEQVYGLSALYRWPDTSSRAGAMVNPQYMDRCQFVACAQYDRPMVASEVARRIVGRPVDLWVPDTDALPLVASRVWDETRWGGLLDTGPIDEFERGALPPQLGYVRHQGRDYIRRQGSVYVSDGRCPWREWVALPSPLVLASDIEGSALQKWQEYLVRLDQQLEDEAESSIGRSE